MTYTTNRVSSPSRPSGDAGTVGNQHRRQPSPASNGRSNSDERLQANSKPSPLAPPNTLLPSRSKNFQAGRSGPTSSNNSVVSSREVSPIRPLPRTNNSTSTSRAASRSRHNSQEFSPSRSSSAASLHHPSIPSALSLQTSLTNANVPYLPPPPVDTDNPKPNKTAMPAKAGDLSTRLPKSSRLMSPPPLPTSFPRNNLQPVGSSRRDQDAPAANTSSKRNQSGNLDEESLSNKQDSEIEGNQPRPVARNVARGSNTSSLGLETVQETGGPEILITRNITDSPEKDELPGHKASGGSGSDSGENKGSALRDEKKAKSTSPSLAHQGDVIPKRSFTSLNSSRGKPGETSMTNMIVETETVSSVPQVALGAVGTERGASGRGPGGATIRLRPSDETIRPKKEKKKQTRKPALATASSKADIFEAKVASAVDDADSSDSEETFVYESNPPDPYPARQHRYHHSRTPSAASAVSQLDQYGGRPRGGLRDALHGISGKRSMKFTNNYNTFDGEGVDQTYGRGNSRANGHLHSVRHHHHIGRHGRNNGHALFSDQSSQGSKPSRHLPNNGNSHYRRFFKRDGDTYGFDFDAEGADDERTPLNGNGRSLRGRYARRPNSSSLRQMDYMGHRRRGCFSRYGACVLLLILLVIFSVGSTLFIIGVTKPLTDVYVNEVQNVLASEQEIMLDLDVQATNPNLFMLTINDLDVNIFAKSRYIGSDSFAALSSDVQSRELPRTTTSRLRKLLSRNAKDARDGNTQNEPTASPLLNTTGVDKGTDPMPDDPAGDPQTMLLGRVFHFDSPLTYEASPWRYISSNSTGQIRLAKPGNKTEEGGSERWERVLQHPFELIVRGVVKYQLPLNSGTRSSSISSKIDVLPEQDNEGDGDGNKEPEHPSI